MLDTIYHNLPAVMEMFKATFKIEFPSIKNVYPHVLKRHDLVHRNGKTKEGETIQSTEDVLNDLIKCVSEFVHEIENKLREKEASL